MKLRFSCLLVVSLLASVVTSTAKEPAFKVIKDVTKRIEMIGYTVLPPQEGEWHYKKHTPAKIEFGGGTYPKGSTLIGMIVLSKLPNLSSEEEFFNFIVTHRNRDSGNPAHEDLINQSVFSMEKRSISCKI